MSYNITSWKIKTAHLELPLDFNFPSWLHEQPESAGKKWCKEDESRVWTDLASQTWKLSLSGHEVSGAIVNNMLVISEIDCRSDGSGVIYEDILLPLFQDFYGSLSAIVVWEGGDTIKQLDIHDGIVVDKELGEE